MNCRTQITDRRWHTAIEWTTDNKKDTRPILLVVMSVEKHSIVKICTDVISNKSTNFENATYVTRYFHEDRMRIYILSITTNLNLKENIELTSKLQYDCAPTNLFSQKFSGHPSKTNFFPICICQFWFPFAMFLRIITVEYCLFYT